MIGTKILIWLQVAGVTRNGSLPFLHREGNNILKLCLNGPGSWNDSPRRIPDHPTKEQTKACQAALLMRANPFVVLWTKWKVFAGNS